MSLTAIFLLSAFLFSSGVTCILIRKNAIQVLMGIELALNAASLNLVAVSRLGPRVEGLFPNAQASGMVFSLFVIVLAASEAAVALAIIVSLFNRLRSVDVDAANRMKE
jgi:NADH:ubiquinone oxidoreductase subunit K